MPDSAQVHCYLKEQGTIVDILKKKKILFFMGTMAVPLKKNFEVTIIMPFNNNLFLQKTTIAR